MLRYPDERPGPAELRGEVRSRNVPLKTGAAFSAQDLPRKDEASELEACRSDVLQVLHDLGAGRPPKQIAASDCPRFPPPELDGLDVLDRDRRAQLIVEPQRELALTHVRRPADRVHRPSAQPVVAEVLQQLQMLQMQMVEMFQRIITKAGNVESRTAKKRNLR